MADVKKTPIERRREALDELCEIYDLSRSLNLAKARVALDELTAETPDQRAERLLGKWLVDGHADAQCHRTFRLMTVEDRVWCNLYRDPYREASWDGEGPTKAEAILDALRKAGCKDV